MAEEAIPPFSARYGPAQKQIDNDCPEKTRRGLVHILQQLVQKTYVHGWQAVITELRRTDRASFIYDDDTQGITPEQYAEQILLRLPWVNVFNFCQRLYSHLPVSELVEVDSNGDPKFLIRKDDIQRYIAGELQLLFLEENLAFDFSAGAVRRRGRRHTTERVARAELVLGDPQLTAARDCFNKALGFFRNPSKPDYENTVKEAVSAVEAAAQVLFLSEGKQLDDIIKAYEGSEEGKLPKPIAKTFYGLYGFRGSGKSVAHGTAGSGSGAATKELAEYALAVAASQIVLLVDFSATLEPDVPF